jgi:phosphopantetheinyl transferase
MPLFWIDSFSAAGAVAIWHISESEEELAVHAGELAVPGEVVHPRKRLEFLAGRAALRILTQRHGMDQPDLYKDEFGKPFIRDSSSGISLTHSFPYAAAIFHKSESVGIDLEQPSQKVLRIRSRFLSPSESKDAGDDLTKLTVYWCAKETLYKWWGKKGVHFESDLFIHPFKEDKEGVLAGDLRKQTKVFSVPLYYHVFTDFVMVYTRIAR